MPDESNPVLNARVGQIVTKPDGRIGEIVTIIKISLVEIDGKLELTSSLKNNPKKFDSSNPKHDEVMKLWTDINMLFR